MANTNELLLGWPGMALDALEAKLQGPGSASLEALFGTQEVNEMRETAAAPALTRAAGQRPNIVLLPGSPPSSPPMGGKEGGLLRVEGLVELLWVNPLVFTRGLINLLELADDGETNANPRVKVVATGLEMMSYAKATLVLRKQANPFLFPYDWRRDIRTAAGLLHQALNRWAASNGYRRFTLVSHSMGGLVSRTYLPPPFIPPNGGERGGGSGAACGASDPAGQPGLWDSECCAEPNHGQQLDAVGPQAPPFHPPQWGGKRGGIRQNSLNRGKALYQLLAASDPQVPIIQIAGYDQATLIAMRGTPDALQPVVVFTIAGSPQQRRWRRAPLVGNPARGGDVLRASRPR